MRSAASSVSLPLFFLERILQITIPMTPSTIAPPTPTTTPMTTFLLEEERPDSSWLELSFRPGALVESGLLLAEVEVVGTGVPLMVTIVVTAFSVVELLESDEVGPVVEASVVVVASLVDVGVVETSVDELSEVDVDESDDVGVGVGVDSSVVEVDSEVVDEADSVSELDEDSVVVPGLELDITISPILRTKLPWPAVTATRDREYKKNESEATRMVDSVDSVQGFEER